jgi:hypothetical protein
MQPIFDVLSANAGPIALAGLVVGIVALLLAWRASRRAGTPVAGRLPSLGLVDDPALDRILSEQAGRLDGMANELEALASRTRGVEAQGRHAIQSIGLVRFNPFEDTGSNQSFAVALVDADANGVILSSLHSRQSTRIYLKGIVGGRCEAALSSEEEQALREAMGGPPPAG